MLLVYSCWLRPYWFRFHGSSETTLTYNMAFLGILMHLLKTNISQVCQECCPLCMCKVCSSLGQKWGNERAITGSKIILTCPLSCGKYKWLQKERRRRVSFSIPLEWNQKTTSIIQKALTRKLPNSNNIPGESKKYTDLTRHNTASIVSILKIRLE